MLTVDQRTGAQAHEDRGQNHREIERREFEFVLGGFHAGEGFRFDPVRPGDGDTILACVIPATPGQLSGVREL